MIYPMTTLMFRIIYSPLWSLLAKCVGLIRPPEAKGFIRALQEFFLAIMLQTSVCQPAFIVYPIAVHLEFGVELVLPNVGYIHHCQKRPAHFYSKTVTIVC